jgi:hypothetical protein
MPFTPSVRTAVFAFGATLLVAAGVFAATLADRYASALASIDTEVLLLFLPCCLLLFAVIVEAIRMTARGPVDLETKARPLAWNVLADE